MFKDGKGRASYIAVLVTFALDLIGFSIVFPILAPFLLESEYAFFPPGTSEIYRTTMLGVAFALFALAQFVASPILGAISDHVGRKAVFLGTIALSVIGYALLMVSIMIDSLPLLLIGRFWTGTCSGNASIAQAAVADIAYPEHRAKAFSYLMGIGGVGFVAGPWLGGLLADPDWLGGSVPFLFVGLVAIVNLAIVYFFFSETYMGQKDGPLMRGVADSFKNLRRLIHSPTLRHIVLLYFLYLIGDSMWLMFCPTYFVQRFDLSAMTIGNLYAYMSLVWMAVLLFFNKELIKHFSLKTLSIWGALLLGVCTIISLFFPSPWPLVILIIPLVGGAALTYSNMATMVSHAAPADFQGRALGVSASALSLAQVVTAMIAGPLAGINLYLPLSVGAAFALVTALLLLGYREKTATG